MFEEFWNNYPRHEGKKKAWISFNKLKPKQQRQAIGDCLTRYSGIEKCFIPLPATYLNGERFEDDPIPRQEKEWDTLAKANARPGESMSDFKKRWRKVN